jgi:carbonyl reductase 1
MNPTIRVAVVTGGNKGIGLAIVEKLCIQFDGHVYLTARDVTRGQESVDALAKKGLNPKFHQLDIESIESINHFRDYLKSTYGGLDVLVNNAAIAFKVSATEPFAEQAETTIRVNYTAHLNVCEALFPLLRDHARVVNVSSSVGQLGFIKSAELRQQFISESLTIPELSKLMQQFVKDAKDNVIAEKGWYSSAYGMSKVGVTALTRIQQRELDKSGKVDIIVTAVHPGYVATDMTSFKGFLTTEQGATAPVICALLPKNSTDYKGAYVWEDGKIAKWDKESPGLF